MLEKQGMLLADLGKITGDLQDALRAENGLADKAKATLLDALGDAINTSGDLAAALKAAAEKLEAHHSALLSLGKAIEQQFAARSATIDKLTGDAPPDIAKAA